MSFKLPDLYVNPPFSWGPPAEELSIDGQPFHLYLKSDALPVADFRTREVEETAKPGGFYVIEDDSKMNQRNRQLQKKKPQTFVKGKFQPKGGRHYVERRHIVELENTYPIRSTTVIYEEIPQVDMVKFRAERAPKETDVVMAGLPNLYNTDMDKVTGARPKVLDESNYNASYYERPAITTDPIIRRLLSAYRGKVVVVSDEVLSLLMTSHMTMHPWHVSVTRFNNIVFIEKDSDAENAGNVDRQWVSETASREIAPSQNDEQAFRIDTLGNESTQVYDTFTKACCKSTRASMKTEPNPFGKGQPRLYTYRNFKLNAGTKDECDVLVRCEVDSVTTDNKFLRIFGLLEQPKKDGTSDWRKTMSAGGGTHELPRAFEMNRGKLGRWITLANLCNAAFMKIGFVARSEKRKGVENITHEVLSLQTDPPKSLAAQLGINWLNLWAIAEHIFSVIYNNVESGDTAMIVKRAGENNIAICEAADDDDEEEEESDDEEESEEEDGENDE